MNTLYQGIVYLILSIAFTLPYQADACGSAQARYALGCESSGSVLLWVDYSINPKPLKGGFVDPSGTLGGQATLSPSGQNCYEPYVSITSGGDGVAVWLGIDNTKSTYTVYSAFLRNGGSWSTAIPLSNTEEGVLPKTINICIDNSGNIQVFYESITYFDNQGTLQSTEQLRLVQGTVANGWNPPTTVLTIR